MDLLSLKPYTWGMKRHFPYKHPVFGTEKKPRGEYAWKESVYYWWFEYLRRNQDYLMTCESQGKKGLIALYKDFGEVRDVTFKQWWTTGGRGAILFAEPEADQNVRVLSVGEAVPEIDQAITISFPLDLPKGFLVKSLQAILKKRHSGKRGVQHAKSSIAKYRLSGQPFVKALGSALKVYDYKQANPDLKLWEIGNQFPGLFEDSKILLKDAPSEISNKKRVLAASVSRYLKQATKSIEATGKGIFP